MLSEQASKLIGPLRRGLLRLRDYLPPSTRSSVANSWLHSGLRLTERAAALALAAREMDPAIKAKTSPTSPIKRPARNDD